MYNKIVSSVKPICIDLCFASLLNAFPSINLLIQVQFDYIN